MANNFNWRKFSDKVQGNINGQPTAKLNGKCKATLTRKVMMDFGFEDQVKAIEAEPMTDKARRIKAERELQFCPPPSDAERYAAHCYDLTMVNCHGRKGSGTGFTITIDEIVDREQERLEAEKIAAEAEANKLTLEDL